MSSYSQIGVILLYWGIQEEKNTYNFQTESLQYFYAALNVLEKYRHKQHTILQKLENTIVSHKQHTILQN